VFYPSGGIPEDAATGSAAGPLAIHLARHGQIGFGEQIEIRQGAEIGRPSLLYAKVTGDRDAIDSVEVAGSALIVAEGRFRITRATAS
jgi:trans-2,3-dihydro-3-hydroxyanthranilate isomerase